MKRELLPEKFYIDLEDSGDYGGKLLIVGILSHFGIKHGYKSSSDLENIGDLHIEKNRITLNFAPNETEVLLVDLVDIFKKNKKFKSYNDTMQDEPNEMYLGIYPESLIGCPLQATSEVKEFLKSKGCFYYGNNIGNSFVLDGMNEFYSEINKTPNLPLQEIKKAFGEEDRNIMKEYKIRIKNNDHTRVQKELFKLGYKWKRGGCKLVDYKFKFLLTDTDGIIYSVSEEDTYHRHNKTIVSLQDLINLNKKEKKMNNNNVMEYLKPLLDNILVRKELQFSTKGMAVKVNKDKYKVYDKTKKTSVELSDKMTIDKIDIFVKIPTKLSSLKIGDLIVQDDVFYFVRKKDADEISAVNVEEGKIEVLLPTTDVLGNSTYTKVFSAVDMLGGYELLQKTDKGILAIITEIYNHKDSLEDYLKTKSAQRILPIIINKITTKNIKMPKVVKDNMKYIMPVLAIGGIVMTNTNFRIDRKLKKHEVLLLVSLIGLLVSSFAYKQGFFEKMKGKIVRAKFVAKIRGMLRLDKIEAN